MRIFGHFSNFDNCRSEVAGDVKSGAALDYVGMDVPDKFGDSRLNSGLIIWLYPAGPVLNTFAQYLVAFGRGSGSS